MADGLRYEIQAVAEGVVFVSERLSAFQLAVDAEFRVVRRDIARLRAAR